MPTLGLARAVEHEVDDAAPSGRAPGGLPDCPFQAVVGVRRHTSTTPDTPLPLTASGNRLRESRGSVSTTGTPRTCIQPCSSQSMAVATAVDAPLPSPPAPHVGRVEPGVGDAGNGEAPRGQLLHVGVQTPGHRAHLALGSRSMPIFRATLWTLRVPVPVACISATAVTGALSAL
jgi:hypothetical protein